MSDGQFSAKPIRGTYRGEVVRKSGEFSAELKLTTDDTRAFLQSPAVQREANALMETSLPDLARRDCAPLHKRTPDAARDLGRPLASATLVQEYLIGLVFLRVCGWIFMACGTLIFLGVVIGAVTTLNRPGRQEPFFGFILAMGFSLAIVAVGAWFGIFRGRVITEMCWFCPGGMIWMTESVFDWYKWEDVPDVYCNLQGDRPAIGVSFGTNVSWISFSDTHASRALVEYIEKQASAACLPSVLREFAEGETIRFGTWRLSRSSVRGHHHTIPWRDVLAVACDGREFWIKQTDGSTTVPLDEIPFPSLFTALALASFGYMREQTGC